MSQQIQHTICLQTKDALRRDESTFRFNLPSDVPRFKAVKIGVGSIEFPMTQWTLEHDWSQVHYNEGLRLDGDSNTLVFEVQRLAERENPIVIEVNLPERINRIERWERRVGEFVATCARPHHLWSHDVPVPSRSATVEVIASPFGRIAIDLAQARRVDDHAFAIPLAGEHEASRFDAPHAGFLFVAPPQSMTIVAEWLSRAANHPLVTLSFRYNARGNQMLLSARARYDSLRLTLKKGRLGEMLGLGCIDRVRDIAKGSEFDFECEPPHVWRPVELAAGFYGPAHRPMCAGRPMDFPTELSLAFNRLTFPLPERVPRGQITAHFIVFIDPCGQTARCPVPAGQFSAETFCEFVERTMSDIAGKTTPGIFFSVAYEDERFVFTCEVRETRTGLVRPVPFTLLFGHPMSADPKRFGFDAITYAGSSTYRSQYASKLPTVDAKGTPPGNTYEVSDMPSQKRLRVHANARPPMTAVIESYSETTSILRVRTHVGQLPYAHGYRSDDVVHLDPTGAAEVMAPSEDEGWRDRHVEACNLAPGWGRSGLVQVADRRVSADLRFCTLDIHVKHTPELRDCVGQCLLVHSYPEPFNLCFGASVPRSVPAATVGFPEGATEWGVDGAILAETGLRLPPFDAPGVHNFDAYDYVLMYLEGLKKGTLLQHGNGISTSFPLFKLCLYPLMREERSIPRETTTISGENLSHFTVRFANPDGTPYHFHGAQFSFTLNLLKAGDA